MEHTKGTNEMERNAAEKNGGCMYEASQRASSRQNAFKGIHPHHANAIITNQETRAEGRGIMQTSLCSCIPRCRALLAPSLQAGLQSLVNTDSGMHAYHKTPPNYCIAKRASSSIGRAHGSRCSVLESHHGLARISTPTPHGNSSTSHASSASFPALANNSDEIHRLRSRELEKKTHTHKNTNKKKIKHLRELQR